MNLLKTIIERLNQRIEVANIFDKQFGLCELNANGNEKAWVHYIGNGQAEVVTNFDAKQGTLFWAKRGKVTVVKTDAFRLSGCKQLYITSFPLTAYAVVRKSHLPCDSEDAQDWLASRIYKITSGTDPVFKQAIGVINYEVVPSGYINEIKTLTANYEWACVSVDFDIQVITTTEDGCYDICQTGDIPLPDLPACTPCLTEVAVDGVTITGNGTAEDPLSAVGGGGGTPLITKEEGTNVSTNTTTLNFTGAGVTASLTSPGVVEVNVPGGGGGGGVTSVSGTAPIASSGGATPAISISQASTSTDGYLSQTDWDTFNNKFDVPTGLVTDYLDGLGTPTPFPAIPVGTVTSVNSGININVDNTNPAAPIINSLADRYKTSSVTSNSISNGSKNFTVDLNLSYIPLQEILVVFNPANHMHGEVTSYNAATGALVVDIKTHTGSGTYTSWVLNLDGTPVDAITGSGTANEIAYFTAARIIASLPVATYPSLTELSYVKGVTSAIQTQINGKQATITPAALTKVDDTNVTLTLGGTPATALLQAASITAGWSGTLADARITSAATWNAKQNAITLTTTGSSGAATLTGATLNIPQYAAPVIYKSTTDAGAFLSIVNTAVYTQLIAANTYAIGDIIRVNFRARKTGTAGIQTLRIYVNATADLSGTPLLVGQYRGIANNTLFQMQRHLVIKSSTANTEVFSTATTGALTDFAQDVPSTIVIDWTATKYFVFALQNASALDTNYGSMYLIEKL
jgi:hypothetical protein